MLYCVCFIPSHTCKLHQAIMQVHVFTYSNTQPHDNIIVIIYLDKYYPSMNIRCLCLVQLKFAINSILHQYPDEVVVN